MLALHGLHFGVLAQENSVVASRKGAGLTDSTRAIRMDGEELPMNELIWKLEMKLLRQQHCGTERVSRRSVAGSSQGLCHASARPNQGLQVVIQEACLQFFSSVGLRGHVSETGFKITSNTCVPKQKCQAQPYTLQLVKYLNATGDLMAKCSVHLG